LVVALALALFYPFFSYVAIVVVVSMPLVLVFLLGPFFSQSPSSPFFFSMTSFLTLTLTLPPLTLPPSLSYFLSEILLQLHAFFPSLPPSLLPSLPHPPSSSQKRSKKYTFHFLDIAFVGLVLLLLLLLLLFLFSSCLLFFLFYSCPFNIGH